MGMINFSTILKGILLLSVVLTGLVEVKAATLCVATNGADSNSGADWANAKLTISNAVWASANGDVILVSNGTYWVGTTNNVVVTNRSVTIRGFSGNPADVLVAATNAVPALFYIVGSTSTVIENLTISNGLYGVQTAASSTGTIQNCIFSGNHAAGSALYLAGVMLADRCIIRDNAVSTYYSVIDLQGGATLRNCLVIRNSAGYSSIRNSAGNNYIENCTIVGNTASSYSTLYRLAGYLYLRNSIVWGNTHPATPNYYSAVGGMYFTNNCTDPLPPSGYGTNNIVADPQFVDQANYDLRLVPGSPSMNTGTNQPWMAGALDLAGNSRTNAAGQVDMGCYEYIPGTLAAGFSATPISASPAPVSVAFTGAAAGTNTSSVTYYWDFNNDDTVETQGVALAMVTNVYATAGVYSVSLLVSNTVGETNRFTRTDYIKASPSTLYVAKAGNVPQFPYDTWTKASSNILSAVAAAANGATVLISNGAYIVTSQITLDATNNLTVRGFSGNPGDVTVDGGTSNFACFYLKGTSTVEYLTTTNAAYGFYFYGTGTVRRCVISNNRGAGAAQFRGGVGVYLNYGGLVENCVIINCAGGDGGGAAALVSGGTLRNCLVTENLGNLWGGLGGGGVYMNGGAGRVENCTVVSNTGVVSAGGVYNYSGVNYVYNSIVVSNIIGGGVTNYNTAGTPPRFYNSDTTPMPGYGTNNITNDPLFMVVGTDQYRLSPNSPCVNVGTNLSWVTNATYLAGQADLAGNRRVIRSIVDMGAYEWQPPAGTVFGFR